MWNIPHIQPGYEGMLHRILTLPQNIVMDMNNVMSKAHEEKMLLILFQLVINLVIYLYLFDFVNVCAMFVCIDIPNVRISSKSCKLQSFTK
jgi:hypothetical protein